MSDEIDITEAHIDLLRELEGGESWPSGRELLPDARREAERDLACWFLTQWSGGVSSDHGERKQMRDPGTYITPAGRAALAAYELGRRREAEPAPKCTGVAARWCAVHGDCSCPRDDGSDWRRTLTDQGCPLHSDASTHADGGATS